MINIGDTFRLIYCPKVIFTLKRIDKRTKIHTFQFPDGKEFCRKDTEVDPQRWEWEKML